MSEAENPDDIRKTEPPPPQLNFPELVAAQLKDRGVKLTCPACRIVGMAAFEFTEVPSVRPTMMPPMIMQEASVVCKKCGYTMLFNLNILGIVAQPQERRVLTASEVAAQQKNRPSLIMP